jgi:CHASE3 domain sensor protein
MKLQFNRYLQVGYGFSILTLLLVGAFSYNTIKNLLYSNDWVEHSHQIIEKLEKIVSVMKDAETGQRGFLLTNEKDFLEPYNGSDEKAAALVNQVKWLTRDNPEQQQNIDEIKRILLHQSVILKELIDKKHAGNVITLYDLKSGKASMDKLRESINKAENDETKLLRQRVHILNRYVFLAAPIIVIAIALAIAIAIFSYLKAISDVNEKERLRYELEIKEKETAAFNEELAAANEELAAVNEEYVSSNEEGAGNIKQRVRRKSGQTYDGPVRK